jgi:hypothetical protein
MAHANAAVADFSRLVVLGQTNIFYLPLDCRDAVFPHRPPDQKWTLSPRSSRHSGFVFSLVLFCSEHG